MTPYARVGCLPNFYRKPYGPGWALVGDAGLHKDPIFALGICDAMRDVEFLADAIADGLSGRAIMAAALAEYERRATRPQRPTTQTTSRPRASRHCRRRPLQSERPYDTDRRTRRACGRRAHA